MISIRELSMNFPMPKRFKDYLFTPFKEMKSFTALENINLEIKDGDRIAFLGVNGAGKTTLLKLIGGLLYPTNGKIDISGYNTVHQNLAARKAVGFVLNEERSFYWRLTGRQNLEFFGCLDNLGGAVLENKIKELIYLVGLQKAADKPVATYSSGMKQRLAIARGLLSNPKILILDEPTRTLDPEAVEDIIALISKRIHEGTERTLLIATHSFEEADTLCNKVCIMRHGRILAVETVYDIKINHKNIAEYYHSIISNKETVLI